MNTPLQPSATVCKVVAPSSRQALRLLREKLGPDAIVLSNTVTADGVEIVATLEEPVTDLAVPTVEPVELLLPLPRPLPLATPVKASAAHASVIALPVEPATGGSGSDSVLREIHSMRGMIEEQLAGLAWNKAQRRDPLRGQLLRTLLGAGFSARLARDLLAELPVGQTYAAGLEYVKATMARQLPMLEDEDALMKEGGVYALMGPTGVGKTTTTAKLAARCVMRFGPEKLALVTTDSYRIGAYEQLRIYGQILGVSVHAVKDAVDLDLVLADLRHKHVVLIDTVGMSQRDRAVSEQIAMLCGASRPVKRLLLLNASSHGDTLNEVVQAYRQDPLTATGNDLAGCILTKVDEATHPGALIDTVIRHQLPIHYISSGQKVPEHLVLGNRSALIDSVFQAKSASALFVPGEADLDEGPAALRNEEKVAAAAAISDRLRSQCQQLVRALAHNAQELSANAAALAAGQIGFDEIRVLWRSLYDDSVGGHTIARALRSQACADSTTSSDKYVLSTSAEIGLESAKKAYARVLVTALLSDRTGLPFAASQQFLSGAGKAGDRSFGQQPPPGFDKPVVHLFARLPSPKVRDELQSAGLQWQAGVGASLQVLSSEDGIFGALSEVLAGRPFSAPQAVVFRGKAAVLTVAEAMVHLRLDTHGHSAGSVADAAMLRCVVRKIADSTSGKTLLCSYLLASADIEASAQQLMQWASWRAATEPYFKLLTQAVLQLGDGRAPVEVAMSKRVLIAAQACLTVFLLQQAQSVWAEAARTVLTQLTGRSVRPGRPPLGSALFEGLGKLFVLLDAMETEGAAVSHHADLTPTRN